MATDIGQILDKIRLLESELDAEVARSRAKLHFGLERGKLIFEQEVVRRHAEMKTSLFAYLSDAHPLMFITAPFIYALIVPLVLLDLFVSLYQAVCFPAYGIAKVKRADYFVFDRRYLAYLNAIEKLNCAFCSYANGLLAYVSEISSRTEQFWCPIKHARRLQGTHRRYRNFVEFGDADAYSAKLATLRGKLANPDQSPD